MLSPIVEQVARDEAGRLKVVELDVDSAPEIAGRLGAQSIPLLLMLRGGNEIDRLVGAVPPPGCRRGSSLTSHLPRRPRPERRQGDRSIPTSHPGSAANQTAVAPANAHRGE